MSSLEVTTRHRARWLRLQRPAHGNALDLDLLEAIDRGITDLGDVRAVVLTGSGSVFCAGADVRAAGALLEDETALLAFMDRANAVLAHLESLPVPTIAAVNGLTMAGGLELALACDLIIAAEDAPIGDGHTRYGFLPAWGATARLPRRAGRATAAWLLATAQPVPAEQLVACGLVTQAVPSEQLVEHVDGLIAQLGVAQPHALAAALNLVRAATERPLDEALAAERAAFRELARGEELRTGIASFGRSKRTGGTA